MALFKEEELMEGLVEINYPTREEDPLGDSEYSPDGENIVIEITPNPMGAWALLENELSHKWGREKAKNFIESTKVLFGVFNKGIKELINLVEKGCSICPNFTDCDNEKNPCECLEALAWEIKGESSEEESTEDWEFPVYKGIPLNPSIEKENWEMLVEKMQKAENPKIWKELFDYARGIGDSHNVYLEEKENQIIEACRKEFIVAGEEKRKIKKTVYSLLSKAGRRKNHEYGALLRWRERWKKENPLLVEEIRLLIKKEEYKNIEDKFGRYLVWVFSLIKKAKKYGIHKPCGLQKPKWAFPEELSLWFALMD